MPWEVTGPMKERIRLVEAHATGRYTVSELAEAFGVSRKTAHATLRRHREAGLQGLAEHSRAAHTHPNATPPAVIAAVIRAKQARPTWGPLKLSPLAGEPPEVVAAWPAPSTRGAILARAGLTRPRHKRKRVPRTPYPFPACDRPNAVWCADFKGWFRTRDGQRCDPLTITDGYSRMLLCCEAVERPDHANVRRVFEGVFCKYGLPAAIRTDNGSPFASVAAGGLTRLAAWWVKLGIRLERIAPGHPEQNGSHERMHLTLKQECCVSPAATIVLQQKCFDDFLHVFNWERPHQALGLRPPASLYTHSNRAYPSEVRDPEYPPDVTVRRVRSNGEIKWQGKLVFISESLVGEMVGVKEVLTGYEVCFGPICLGQLMVPGERLIRPDGRLRKARTVTHALS